MTNRVRILSALAGKEVDRLPWSPLIDHYFVESLPDQGLDMDILECMDYIGNDIMERHVAGARYIIKNFNSRLETRGDRTRMTYETPVGTIYEERGISGKTEFTTKHFVETIEDAKILQYIADNTSFQPALAEFEERDRQIGDRGIATVSLTPSPIQELLQQLAGIENTIFLMADHPEGMDEMLNAMHERNKRHCRTLCEYPTPVVFQYEDTSTTVMNKHLLNNYELNCIDDYAQILHENAKLYITHMCGKLDGFKGEIARANMDGIDSVCPPTTGDLSCWDAREAFGGKIIIGGIEPPSLVRMTVRETLECVIEIINKMENKLGFILSTGDAVPYGTPIKNMLAVTLLIRKLGRQSLSTGIDASIIDEVVDQLNMQDYTS